MLRVSHGVRLRFLSDENRRFHSSTINLVSKKGVQQIDCDGGKNYPDHLEPGPIVFAEHFTTPANARALDEPVRFENVGYADPSKCYEKENQNETKQRLLHTKSLCNYPPRMT